MAQALQFISDTTRDDARVSALFERPSAAKALYIFAHGAGANMNHPFMATMADALAAHEVATLRFNFPYMEAGKKRPDATPRLLSTIREAVRFGRSLAPELPLFAGGKSMGGRMTSLAASMDPLEGVHGLVFLGFPLHPAGKPGIERADHLFEVSIPMLFVQGTKDRLAEVDRLLPVLDRLGSQADRLIIQAGDHSLHVPKRSGQTDHEVIERVAKTMAATFERWLTAPSSGSSSTSGTLHR